MFKNLIIYFCIILIGLGNIAGLYKSNNNTFVTLSYETRLNNTYVVSFVLAPYKRLVSKLIERDLESQEMDEIPARFVGRGFIGSLRAICRNWLSMTIYEIKFSWNGYWNDYTNQKARKKYFIKDINITRNGFPLNINKNIKIKMYEYYVKYLDGGRDDGYGYPDNPAEYQDIKNEFKKYSGIIEEGDIEIFFSGGFCIFYKNYIVIGIIGGNGITDKIPSMYSYDPNKN